MKRTAFLLVSLVAICIVHSGDTLASSSVDAQTCHHHLDLDRGRAAAMSDPAKKAETTGHLKAAYTDEKKAKFTDCLSELKAAEALMQ
jgi:hypothetical protein